MANTTIPSELIADGAITSAKLDTNIAVGGTLTVTGEITANGGIALGDGDVARFNSNLNIFSSGTTSYIEEVGAGDLYLKASSLYITDRDNNQFMTLIDNGTGGTVSLMHNTATKIATTATGIDVTGTATMDGLTVNSGTGNTVANFSSTDIGAYLNIADQYQTGRLNATGSVFKIEADPDNAYASTALTFTTDGTERLRIDSSGRLLVGTTSVGYSGVDLTVGDTTDSQNGLAIQTSTTGIGYVLFGDGTGASAFVGQIAYAHSDNSMQFDTAGSERLRIESDGNVRINDSLDNITGTLTLNGRNTGNILFQSGGAEKMRLSGGNLLVGTTSVQGSGGVTLSGAGYVYSSRPSSVAIYADRTGSDGDIIEFRKDGTTVGGIGVMHTNNMYFTGASGHGGLQFGTANVTPLIAGSESNGGVDLGASNLRFKDLHLSGSAFIDTQTRLGNGSASSPAYSFSADSDSGMFRATTNQLGFATNGQEAARIDASQNLLVGKTSLGIGVTGTEVRANGQLLVTADADNPADFNRKTSDGVIALFRKDGTTVGSIGTSGSALVLGNGNAGFYFNSSLSTVMPWNITNNTNSDAAIDIGHSANRFKDLYLSGGVYLGGTGAANKLDDYEEGTWTPALVGSSTAGTATFISGPTGTYTKIGNQVTVYFDWNISAHTGTGALRVNGLPFTSTGAPVGAVMAGNYTYPAGKTNLVAFGVGAVLRFYGTGDGVGYTENTLDVAHQMNGSLTYTV